jgi:hypothetical protein
MIPDANTSDRGRRNMRVNLKAEILLGYTGCSPSDAFYNSTNAFYAIRLVQ